MGVNSQFDLQPFSKTSDDLIVRDTGLLGLATIDSSLISDLFPGISVPATTNGLGGENFLSELFGLTSTSSPSTTTVLGSTTPTSSTSVPSSTFVTSSIFVTSSTLVTSFTSTPLTTSSYPAISEPARANPPVTTTTSVPAASSSQANSTGEAIAKTHLPATAEHLLIAASSIAATLAIVFIIFSVYRIRRGYSFQDLWSSKKRRRTPPVSRRITSHRRVTSWNSFLLNAVDAKEDVDEEVEVLEQANDLPSIPKKALLRPDTSTSNWPLISVTEAPDRTTPLNASRNTLKETTEEGVDESQNSSPPPRNSRLSSPSLQPSSPILPIERTDENFYDETESSHPSLPTYMKSAESFSIPPKHSRFSWTNSQAPKTPNETRFSIATSTSSVPRYRTIDSWVGVQTGRIDPARFQEHLRLEGRISSESIPDVPSLPPKSPSKASKSSKSSKASKHSKASQRQPRMSDASIFRVHPGTRIDIPRTSTIPSEVLDQRVHPHAF